MAGRMRIGRFLVAAASALLLVSTATPATAAPGAPGPDAYWATEPPISIGGAYQGLVGDFDGDLDDDIYWYAGSQGTERLWLGEAGGPIGGAFRDVPAPQVNGDYRPLVGNFAGDRSDDIFWYGPGSLPDVLWINGFHHTRPDAQHTFTVNGTYQPFVLDDSVGWDGIVWLDPAVRATRIWTFTRTGISSVTTKVRPESQPVVGDFDGNGRMDILWYGRGLAFDQLTWRTATEAKGVAQWIYGTYDVVSGRFDGDDTWDIWFQPRPGDPRFEEQGTAFVWFGDAPGDRDFVKTEESSAPGRPIVLPKTGTARADDLLLVFGSPSDIVRRNISAGLSSLAATGNTPVQMWPSQYLVGNFSNGSHADLLAYGESGWRGDQLYVAPRPAT